MYLVNKNGSVLKEFYFDDCWLSGITLPKEKVEDRYFMIYQYRANTEYQDTEYDWQPDEVYPVERTIICWEGVPPQNV